MAELIIVIIVVALSFMGITIAIYASAPYIALAITILGLFYAYSAITKEKEEE